MTAGADGSPSIAGGPETAPPATLTPLERIAGVFISPVETLRDIARRPDFLIPLLLILVISVVCTAIAMRHIDFAADIRAGFENSDRKMTAEQAERALKWGVAIGRTAGWASPLLVAVWWAIYAFIVLIVFRLFGADMTYRQSFAVKVYSVLPGVVRGIITAIVLSTRGVVSGRSVATIVRSNPGFLVDLTAHPLLFSLLTSLDVFTLWGLVLSVIGYAYAANVSRTRSALAIVGLFLLGVFLSVGFAALGAGAKSA
jgi:hypothetical protein